MFTISKEFHFSASHILRGLPSDHPCTRMHGHNYKVKVTIYAENLVEPGFVIDYRDLDPFKEYLDSTFDHRHLNHVLYREDDEDLNPTAEILARLFFYVVRDGEVGSKLELLHGTMPTIEVGVSETDKTWAYYTEVPDAPAA